MDPIGFLFSLPLWLLALVLFAWLAGTGLVGLWIVRRWVVPGWRMRYEDAYYAAPVAQSVMVLYGLIAALTAVDVWGRYARVEAIVADEASAIASLWRDLGGYPQPLRDETRALLRDYTDQVINGAWPQQRAGRVPGQGVEWMDRLQERLFAFEPASGSQSILHAEAIGAFNDLVKQRRLRLDSVRSAIPGVLWWVLLPGALGCVVMSLFFKVESARLQGTLLVGLAAFLTMVLFIIFALDRPFVGDTGITAQAYQLVFDHYMR
jgi:hypothetical protein